MAIDTTINKYSLTNKKPGIQPITKANDMTTKEATQ